MTDKMEEGYNKEIDIYSRDITNHYYYASLPCILPPDHRKHASYQRTQSFSYRGKTIQNATPLAYCQTDIQKKFERNYHD